MPVFMPVWFSNCYISNSQPNPLTDWGIACHVPWPKLTELLREQNSLSFKQNNNLNYRLTCDQVVHFQSASSLSVNRPQEKIVFAFLVVKRFKRESEEGILI